MTKESMSDRARASGAFSKAVRMAKDYAQDPAMLRGLLEAAAAKAGARGTGPFAEVREALNDLMRLLWAYARRDYTKTPWQTLLLVTAAVIYFVNPFDLVPDFVLGVGLLDDAALLAWTLRAVKSDVEDFREWERRQ